MISTVTHLNYLNSIVLFPLVEEEGKIIEKLAYNYLVGLLVSNQSNDCKENQFLNHSQLITTVRMRFPPIVEFKKKDLASCLFFKHFRITFYM